MGRNETHITQDKTIKWKIYEIIRLRSNAELMNETSALKLFTVANFYVINSVDYTLLPCYTLYPTQHNSLCKTYCIYSLGLKEFMLQFLTTSSPLQYLGRLLLHWILLDRYTENLSLWNQLGGCLHLNMGRSHKGSNQ